MSYGDMQTRIADELSRSDLTDQIKSAITSAIRAYEGEQFYFNQLYRQTATVAAADYAIPLPSNVYSIASLTRVTNATIEDYLGHRDADQIIAAQTPLVTGQPKLFAIYADQILFDCRSDQTYTLYINGLQKFTDLSANADSNAWMTTAEELIRNRAKVNLYADVLMDKDNAMVCADREQRALEYLRSRGAIRGSGRVRPTRF